jgi:tetratricopeptide (TPR) repeat protein
MARQKGVSKAKPTIKTNGQYPYSRYFEIILAIVPFLLYAHTLTFGFVYHDDDTIIINGAETLKRFSLYELFTTDAWLMQQVIELYRPWQSLTFAFDYLIGSGKPWIFHLHNVVVFTAAIQLLFRLLKKLGINQGHAFYLSLLYSVHFLFAHTVSWIPARGDLYLSLFCIAGILTWIHFIEHGSWLYLFITGLLYMLALFAKESAMALPLLLVLIAALYYRNAVTSLKLAPALVLFAVVAAIYIFMHNKAVAKTDSTISVAGLLYNLPVIPEEIFKFFIPASFSVMPAFNPWVTGIGIILLIAITFGIILFRKKTDHKLLLLGIALFTLPILPSLLYKPQFIGFAYDYLDHRMFFPGIGLLLIAYTLLQPYIQKINSRYWPVYPAVAMACVTFINSNNYKDKFAYYENATQTDLKSGLAWINYGIILANENRLDEAIDKVSHIVTLYPDSVSFRIKRAQLYIAKKDYPNMLNDCHKVIKQNPGYYDAYYHIAGYYNDMNMTDSAISILTSAIQNNNTNAVAYYHRGIVFRKAGKINEALADLDKSIAINPKDPQLYFERGDIYGNQLNFEAALADFDKYTQLRPEDGNGFFYRGQALCLLNRKEEGCKDLNKAAAMGVEKAGKKIGEFCK